MRDITISLSKKSRPRKGRIAKVCLHRHLTQLFLIAIALLWLLTLVCVRKAQEVPGSAVPLNEQDIVDTIKAFKTSDAAKSVEGFKKKMPKPVQDSKVRQEVVNSLPASLMKLRIDNDQLLQKTKRLMYPVLSAYKRETVYEVILVRHPTPLIMVDSGVVIVISTGMLSETTSDDELLGFIAHEVGHEYFAHYSLYTKYLLQKWSENGEATALTRNLHEILGLIELQCDMFASLTLAHLGYDPLAFLTCLERMTKKFPTDPTNFHPAEDVRRRAVSGVLPSSSGIQLKNTSSPLLNAIKSDLQHLPNH